MTDTAMIPFAPATASPVPLAPAATLALIPQPAQPLLGRMFANPNMLAAEEKTQLVSSLRECVLLNPKVSELRVLYGMALCVNLDAQEAMEQLGEAVALTPHSFIAHLKMGELWMRLRVCSKAKDHTQQAALLAENIAQAELARKQAATIRQMLREGIERSGYTSWFSLGRIRRLWTRHRSEDLTVAEIS
jgi:Flp pilus assembly protein TadD